MIVLNINLFNISSLLLLAVSIYSDFITPNTKFQRNSNFNCKLMKNYVLKWYLREERQEDENHQKSRDQKMILIHAINPFIIRKQYQYYITFSKLLGVQVVEQSKARGSLCFSSFMRTGRTVDQFSEGANFQFSAYNFSN